MSDRKPESVGRKPNREEINAMRIKAFLSNLYADQMDYFKACSGWFQDEDYRELERADLHRAEVEAAVKRAIEACADEIDCGGCYGQCQDPANCHAKEASAIRALATDPAALERIINGGRE